MIIDIHTHLDDAMHTKFTVEKRLQLLLETMKQNKIDHAFVLADIDPKEKTLSNDELLKLVEHYKQLHVIGKVPLPMCLNAR